MRQKHDSRGFAGREPYEELSEEQYYSEDEPSDAPDLFNGEEPVDPLLYAQPWTDEDYAAYDEGAVEYGYDEAYPDEYAEPYSDEAYSDEYAEPYYNEAPGEEISDEAEPPEEREPAPRRSSPKLRRRALRTTAPFYAALALLTVLAWTLPLRPSYSAMEKRDLQPFPDFSVPALFSGDWFDGINLWFSDTFPLRERWMEAQTAFSEWYGDRSIKFSGSLSGIVEVPEVEVTPEPTPVPTAAPVEATPEPTPEPTPDPASGVTFDPNEARKINAAVYFGDAGYEVYNLGKVSAEAYSKILSDGADKYAGQCRLFSIICPNSGGIMLAYDIYDQLYLIRQDEAIKHFYTNKSDNLIPVYIYDTLRAHNTEYLYFRTDHHWTGLAAWYAYEQWCEAAGFTPVPLSEYTEMEFPGFLGSYYQNSLSKEMLNNPDTVIAYQPKANITMRYHAMGGGWVEGNCVIDKTDAGYERKYLAFLDGDHYITEIINNDIDDDSACLLLKDSFGNPFGVYLAQHYHTVVILDWHYDNPISPVVNQYGIDDIIVLTELVQAQGKDMLANLTGDFMR